MTTSTFPVTIAEADAPIPSASASAIVVKVPDELSETSVAEVMAGSEFAADLKSILRTRERLATFVRRLDAYLTGLPIAPGGGPLLRVALEASIRAYLVGQLERKVQDARFMGAALAVTSAGLVGYRISGKRGSQEHEWRPQEAIRHFIRVNQLDTLRFDLRHPPDLAEQRAMRWIVTNNVARFDDLVAMERGGVDYRTFAV